MKIENFKLKIFAGTALMELILAMGLAVIIFPALLTGFFSARNGKVEQAQRMQAVALLKETEQAVSSIRNSNWAAFASLTTAGALHPIISANVWATASGSQTIGNLTRQFNVYDVNRDTNGAIVTSGGANDPSTKKIVITVSWEHPYHSDVNSTLYLTRTSNATYSETDYSQFILGTRSDVIVATTSGSTTDGQIQLGAGSGGGDWCSPSFLITTVDLPKSGVANAITAIKGPASNQSTVFAGTGENASGVSFAKVDLPGNPPSASTPATFDGYKTNAVFGESGYAYLATDNNSKEIVIMDLNQYSDPPTNSKYKEVNTINLSGNVNGSSIYVANDKAYITSSDKKLYIYNLNSTRTLATQSASVTLDGIGKKVLVTGGYAYVATDSTTYPFEIVNLSSLSIAKLNLGTGQSGVDTYVNTSNSNPDRAYLATSESSTHAEFYVINITDKANPKRTNELSQQLGTYETSGMTPTGITVVTGNRAVIVGTGGTYQYQVINLAPDTGTLTLCGSNAHLSYPSGIRGVASVLQNSGYAYSYVITSDASSELKIILGGAGNTFTSSGTYTSAIYDPGYSVEYNRFVATVNQPSQTTLKIQVAVKNSGSCSSGTYTYVGPNGDSSSYFLPVGASISATIPFGTYSPSYQNPARCFKYKAWLDSTDATQTPIIYDTTINYSP